jgi:hypothetical protein
MAQPGLHPDFKDLLSAFAAERVEYLLIGGYAVSFHARPRWFGVAPARVDILRRAEGIEFSAAYERRVEVSWDGVPVSIIAREDLIAAKRAAGREQDLRDVRALERSEP